VKAGAEYEQFVYAKFLQLFPDAVVTLNDRIVGQESNILRELDVSVRMTISDVTILYIVQCKDWSRRADINTLGAFSAVMQDVGAAKGFLLCTAGFYETNHKYALARGIELVTIEDIGSERWTATVQIPLVYIRKLNGIHLTLAFYVSEAVAELNRDRDLVLDLNATSLRGAALAAIALPDYVVARTSGPPVAADGVAVDLTRPDLEVCLGGVWTRCTRLSVVPETTVRRYLKYLTPTEYSHLKDHVRNTILPLQVRLEDVSLAFDSTFVEIPADLDIDFPGLSLRVQEWSIIPERVGAA
jgi:hypothetical protein